MIQKRYNTISTCNYSGTTGFTIVEFLVAAVVGCTVMIGAYVVFTQGLEVESVTYSRLNQKRKAQSTVLQISESIENAINFSNKKTIQGGVDQGDSTRFLRVYLSGAGSVNGAKNSLAFQRRQYKWNYPYGDEYHKSLTQQIVTYSGTQNISPIAGIDQLKEDEVWSKIPSEIIAKKINSISILYKTLSDANAEWKADFSGSTGDVAVLIRATVGNETYEKIITPHTNKELGGG